jgi:hypothetical protein
MRIAVIFGEICYNLRTALDYLISHLAELDSRSPQDGTQFPIEDTPNGFAYRIKRGWLKGVNTAHVTAIERLQPYNGCNWMARLRDCSNPDKHRKFVQHLGKSQITIWHGFEQGVDLSRILGLPRRAKHPVHGHVDVKVHIAATITFTDGTPVIESIAEIKSGVAQTLADFKPDFQRRKSRPARKASLSSDSPRTGSCLLTPRPGEVAKCPE